MKKYLLDTNICIYYMKGLYELNQSINRAGVDNCFISEITLAELKFGVENSQRREKNQKALDGFLSSIQVLPIYDALDIYAKEKVRLRKAGRTVDDFDLLIGATAVHYGLIMVTNNISHFDKLRNIKVEDWTQ